MTQLLRDSTVATILGVGLSVRALTLQMPGRTATVVISV